MGDEHKLRNHLHDLSRERRARMNRREFLGGFSTGIGSLILTQDLLGTSLPEDEFFVARIQYGGGDWYADMESAGLSEGSEQNLLTKISRETMIRAKIGEYVVKPGDAVLRSLPFLYMTGHIGIRMDFDEMRNIREAVKGGSTLFAEDCGGRPEVGFDKAFRMLLPNLFPDAELKRIDMKHDLFHCMFDINEIQGGDKFVEDFMWGIEIDGRLAVIYTRNDLGCAWEGHNCTPGGESQRSHAFELGMNIATYVLTRA